MPRFFLAKRAGVRRRGFQLVEVMVAVALLAVGATTFMALYPTASRGSRLVSSYTQAVSIVQHKVDQLRAVGFGSLDYDNLRRAGLIDAAPSTGPYRFDGIDQVQDQLSNAVGTIAIGAFGSNMRSATIRLEWSDGDGSGQQRRRSHEVSLLIARTQ